MSLIKAIQQEIELLKKKGQFPFFSFLIFPTTKHSLSPIIAPQPKKKKKF